MDTPFSDSGTAGVGKLIKQPGLISITPRTLATSLCWVVPGCGAAVCEYENRGSLPERCHPLNHSFHKSAPFLAGFPIP